MDSLALWSSTVWLTICVRFTFWEDSDAEGAQIFILTPQVIREDVPTKFPDATPVWSVEASTIRGARSRLTKHMGWGLTNWFERPRSPDQG
jgi:hypothetical protein